MAYWGEEDHTRPSSIYAKAHSFEQRTEENKDVAKDCGWRTLEIFRASSKYSTRLAKQRVHSFPPLPSQWKCMLN